MIKLFNRIFWHNNTTPAINEDNLNAMSKAIDDIDDRVIELGGEVLETVPELQDLADRLEAMTENPPYIGANGDWYIWNTTTGAYVDSGVDASITVTIADITMLAYNQTPNVTNSGTNTDPIFHLFIPRGAGIASVAKTGSTGIVDHYRMTFDNGQYFDYDVTNGLDGQDGEDGTDGVSPTVTITTITGGHTVTITDKDHPTGQSFNVMDGSGDMQASVYDPLGNVAIAGGIEAYAARKATLLTQTLAANATSVTFSNIPTTGNNLIEFYIDGGANYTAVNTATAGEITLTYDALSASRTVYCKIEEVV